MQVLPRAPKWPGPVLYGGCHNRLVKSWFWEKDSSNMGICDKVLVFWHFRGQFLHENTVFAPNPSSNFKIKYWRFQSVWNLKIDFATIFWDILTLHHHNSKSSLPTTGTFRYVESQILRSLRISCCDIFLSLSSRAKRNIWNLFGPFSIRLDESVLSIKPVLVQWWVK